MGVVYSMYNISLIRIVTMNPPCAYHNKKIIIKINT
jgi:hypothetical protein